MDCSLACAHKSENMLSSSLFLRAHATQPYTTYTLTQSTGQRWPYFDIQKVLCLHLKVMSISGKQQQLKDKQTNRRTHNNSHAQSLRISPFSLFLCIPVRPCLAHCSSPRNVCHLSHIAVTVLITKRWRKAHTTYIHTHSLLVLVKPCTLIHIT